MEKYNYSTSENFNIVLCKARIMWKLKQKEMGRLLGIKQSALSKIENGKRKPSASQWVNFFSIFKVNPYVYKYSAERIENELRNAPNIKKKIKTLLSHSSNYKKYADNLIDNINENFND